MLARMQDKLRTIRRAGNAWQSNGFFDQRPQLTWARVIDSLERVPELYLEFVCSWLSHGEEFPYIVLAPAYENFRNKITEKIICVSGPEIKVLERNGKAITAQSYPLAELSYVEVSSILLDFRVRITGITSQGIPASSLFRSSAATDYLFAPILRQVRLQADASKGVGQAPDLERFNSWSSSSFKFMNFARRSVLAGEKVLDCLLQPEIRAKRFTFLNKTFYRTLSLTHACILTDQELILIREEALPSLNDKYGGIWEYIPLNRIATLSTSTRNNNLLALSIKLVTGDSFECLFDAAKQDEVEQFLVQFHKISCTIRNQG